MIVVNELVGTESETLKELNANENTTWFAYSDEEEFEKVVFFNEIRV